MGDQVYSSRAGRELVRKLEGATTKEQSPHQKENQNLRVPPEAFGKKISCDAVRGLGA